MPSASRPAPSRKRQATANPVRSSQKKSKSTRKRRGKTRPPSPSPAPRREHLGKNDIKRLARRGGVKRLSSAMDGEVRGILEAFLRPDLLRRAVAYASHDDRQTVQATDVKRALKLQGRALYS
jgi:histone H4